MKVGSLFSGIGGLDLGLERSGMEVLWQCESDAWCRRVLEKHWPDVKRFSDIRELRHPPAVDLIAGGPPCQPVSHAGRRKGEADERWLWPEFYRIICEVRPRWVLVENVPGLRSIEAGRLFGGTLRDLAAGGYDAWWDGISAAGVGAPHLRERVFIIASKPLADATGSSRGSEQGQQQSAGTTLADTSGTGDVADAEQPRLEGHRRGYELRGPSEESKVGGNSWWSVEPDVGRVAHGVPSRVDRLRGLGNAVVPQVAEFVGRMIMDKEGV